MIPEQIEVVTELDEADDINALRKKAARKLEIAVKELPAVGILKRSIDARHGRVRLRYLLGTVSVEDPLPPLREVSGLPVVIVGAGPAGLFCSYELARHGIASRIVDRGKKVQPRRRDLKLLNARGKVVADSNYCFGEGGAGTYSDGKLYTRAHKRGDVRDVLRVLVECGAPEGILVDARPHIGSNKLPKVVTALREELEAVGVQFHFETRVTDLRAKAGATCGVDCATGAVDGAEVVIATGHSARDVYELLAARDVPLEAKGFALGLRIEHPQPLIDQIQYGRSAGHERLSSAAYRLAHQVEGKGVFSFCMCPGGWIVPASTDEGELVVNGMSLSRRDSPFANSGLVTAIEPEEWEGLGFAGPMGGLEFQRQVEKGAWQAGGGSLVAPASRVTDFVGGRGSSSLPATSYRPGLNSTSLVDVLDQSGLELASRIRQALVAFDRKLRGYLSNEAIVVGVESRTSSPVRVRRDPQTLESPGLGGLYPCGEGAGYAGGIMSAALDGIRVARAIAARRGVL